MIQIAHLADHLETIPTLAEWFRAQWPDYFAGRTLAAIAQDFHGEANRSGLPLRLVAFVDDDRRMQGRALDTVPIHAPAEATASPFFSANK